MRLRFGFRDLVSLFRAFIEAHNYPVLLAELEMTTSIILSNLYSDIFGRTRVSAWMRRGNTLLDGRRDNSASGRRFGFGSS